MAKSILSELYSGNLPGTLVDFPDGGYALKTTTTTPKTGSMLILGTSIDGPVLEPVAVDINTAELLIGSDVKANNVPNGTTLLTAVKQAAAIGCEDIRIMRITGSTSKTSIFAPPTTEVNQVKVEEAVGYTQGNDLTTFNVSHGNLVPGTAKVYAKGQLVTTGVIVQEVPGTIQLNANVCDAGSSLSVTYNYYETQSVTDEAFTVDASGDATISLKAAGNVGVVKMGGVTLNPTWYVITDDQIHVNSIDGTNAPIAGDAFTISYTGITTNILTSTENGNAGVPYVALTSDVTYTLADTPIVGTPELYADNVKVLDATAFSVNYTTKVLTIHKDKFSRGVNLVVVYYKDQTVTIVNKLDLESYFGGKVYDEGHVEVSSVTDPSTGTVIEKIIKIFKPESKKKQVTELPLTYSSNDYPTLELLMGAINADVTSDPAGIYKASTETYEVNTIDLIDTTIYFSGGDDGLKHTKPELFKILSGERDSSGFLVKEGVYQLLENYQVDSVVLSKVVCADDELPGKYDNFAYELGLFCAILTLRTKTTNGFINISSCKDTSLLGKQNYVNKLKSLNNIYILRDEAGNIVKNSEGNPYDLGKFLNVCGGPEAVVPHSKSIALQYTDNAVAYAAFNSTLLAQSGPTNKKIPGTTGLRFSLSNAQLESLNDNRIVTFKNKYLRSGQLAAAAYCTDDLTAAIPGSNFSRLTTFKILRVIADDIREVSDPYLGEAYTTVQHNSLSSAYSKRFGQRKEAGTVVGVDFQVLADFTKPVKEAQVEVSVTEPQELKKVTAVIGLSNSGMSL